MACTGFLEFFGQKNGSFNEKVIEIQETDTHTKTLEVHNLVLPFKCIKNLLLTK